MTAKEQRAGTLQSVAPVRAETTDNADKRADNHADNVLWVFNLRAPLPALFVAVGPPSCTLDPDDRQSPASLVSSWSVMSQIM